MKLLTIALTASCLLTHIAASKTLPPYKLATPGHKVYPFETTEDISEFSTGKKASIGIDSLIFREGKKSLKWSWQEPGAVLTFTNDKAFKNLTGENADPIVYEWITATTLSSFSVWVYNEQPINDVLWFEFGHGSRTDSRCWMTLDFSGWQKFDFIYGRDLAQFPNQKDADCVRIIAPKSLAKGSLHFDQFAPRTEVDVRRTTKSEQAPWAHNKNLSVAKLDPYDYLKNKKKYLAQVTKEKITITSKMTEKDRADIIRMQERYLKTYRRDVGTKPVSEKTIATIRENFKKRGLTRNPETGFMSGTLSRMTARDFWKEAMMISSAYHRSTDEKQKQYLLETFFCYSDLVAQRGHIVGYGLRTIFNTPILEMREELVKHGKWKPLLKQFRKRSELVKIYHKHTEANADDYNTRLRAILFFILVDVDLPQVYQDLCALERYMETTARNGEIKPDGSVNHHQQYYTGYSIPVIDPIIEYCELTYGTSFFNPTMHLYIRRAAYSHYYLSAAREMPRVLSGRWAGSSEILTPGFGEAFRRLAFMHNPEKGEPYISRTAEAQAGQSKPIDLTKVPKHFDREMASIYLTYCAYTGTKNKWTKKFEAMGIQPDDLSGNLSINYAVANSHRRDDWMVFIRGQRAPMLTGENYSGATNDPGRYMNYGYMEVISNGSPYANISSSTWPKAEDNKKFPSNGWNYNFYPGTTVHELPHSALRSHFIIDERATSSTFAGSTSLYGNGVFGMQLVEDLPGELDPKHIGPVKYWLGEDEYNARIKKARFDTSFKAKKSYFCFDNRIVCLGSDIQNSDPESSVCTTLFQHVLSAKEKSTMGIPQESKIDTTDGASYLLDKNGTAYYLPKGNAPLEVSRKHRKLPYYKEWRFPHFYFDPKFPEQSKRLIPNQGVTELAILRHGANIKNKGYEYCVLVRPDKNKLDAFAKQMQDPATAVYTVLQKDKRAHVLKDNPSQTTGYVIFEAGEINQGLLVSSDNPCMTMIQEMPDGGLAISIHDPRIAGDHSELENTEIKLVIKGHWTGKAECLKNITQQGDTTVLTVRLHDLLRKTFTLAKAK